MVDLEPSCSNMRDTPVPSINDDPEENLGKFGYISTKKHLHPRTEEESEDSGGGGDDKENAELARKKRAKKNNSEWEADSSPSSDYSCFVAYVTDSNLQKDELCLPKDFTSSNGIKRECCEIVLKDEGGKTWALDLTFNKSSETFYVNRGWRCFCNENGKKAGSFFVFKLVENGEIPVLSFCIRNRTQRECSEASGRKSLSTELISEEESSEDECSSLEVEKEKYHLRWRDGGRLRLPIRFSRKNDTKKPEMVTLMGKDGIKQQMKLTYHKRSGGISLGEDWKDFVKANVLKTGDSFILKLIWEDKTPLLSLSLQECRDSTSPNKNRFVTLTVTEDNLRKGRLHLPSSFVRENGITKPGMITLLGKNGKKWPASLLQDYRGTMSIGNGWKDFAEANGLKIGDSFTFESTWEHETPILSLLSVKSTSEKMQEGECSKASDKKSIPSDGKKTKKAKKDSTSPSQNRFVTLTLTHDSLERGRLNLPLSFTRENGITKPGIITLLGYKDSKKWVARLRRDNRGTMTLGNGWKAFAEANGLKIGDSFTFELIWENETPVLSLVSAKSTGEKIQVGDCEKEPSSTEPHLKMSETVK